jgi:hypothetical protein
MMATTPKISVSSNSAHSIEKKGTNPAKSKVLENSRAQPSTSGEAKTKKAHNPGSAGAVPKIVEYKAGAKSPTPDSLQSMKSVLDFFHQTPELRRSYAVECANRFLAYSSGVIAEYPKEINSPGDIADFCLKSKAMPIGNAGMSVAEAFFTMHIGKVVKTAKKAKDKKKADQPPSETMDQISATIEAVVADTGAASTKVALRETPIRRLHATLKDLPHAGAFFSKPRAAAFSSNGGLHDISCDICREIGFYNILEGSSGKRGLAFHQKQYVWALHEQVNDEGNSLKDVKIFDALLEEHLQTNWSTSAME